MKLKNSLNYKHGKTIDAKKVFLICALVLIYCPFFYTDMIGNHDTGGSSDSFAGAFTPIDAATIQWN